MKRLILSTADSEIKVPEWVEIFEKIYNKAMIEKEVKELLLKLNRNV